MKVILNVKFHDMVVVVECFDIVGSGIIPANVHAELWRRIWS